MFNSVGITPVAHGESKANHHSHSDQTVTELITGKVINTSTHHLISSQGGTTHSKQLTNQKLTTHTHGNIELKNPVTQRNVDHIRMLHLLQKL